MSTLKILTASRVDAIFCESSILFDYRTESNLIARLKFDSVRLSSINRTFDLVRLVTSGFVGRRVIIGSLNIHRTVKFDPNQNCTFQFHIALAI